MGQGEQLRQRAWEASHQERQRRRRGVFEALAMLHRFSHIDRVRKCRRVRVNKVTPIEIRIRPVDRRAHFANLQTCGSVWSCPACSERILAGRARELHKAIVTHTKAGGDVLLLTLTMRHDRGQGLAELWDALGEAWRSASSGSRSVRELLRSCDWARRVEVTYGENGWHVHLHALLFVGKGTDPEPIGSAMFAAWSKRLVGLGLQAPELGPGMTIKRLNLQEASKELAEYLAKGRYKESLDPQSRAALELASSVKLARRGNRTPMQLLADFVKAGEASDAELWREWEDGSFGRRAITWSRGARERLVGDVELTDEELAQESDGAGIVVAGIDPQVWPSITARPKLMQSLLAGIELCHPLVGDTEVWKIVQTALDRHGLPGVAVRPPPVGELAS